MIPSNIPYLIGETAFHHEGDVPFLKQLVDHAESLKLNAVKFHLLMDINEYMIAEHAAINDLAKWCLDEGQWTEISEYTSSKNIDVIYLCNDVNSLRWILNKNIPCKAIELHATGLNDYFLLEEASKFNGTVILGVGGSSLDEIFYAIDFLEKRNKTDIFLMYGFQNYPTDYADVNLERLKKYQSLFNYPIGYADHTDPEDDNNAFVSVMATAVGVNVLEKHFTHAYGDKRIDAQSAVSIDTMKKIKELQNTAFTVLGNGSLELSAAEKKYGDTGPMKKAIVASKVIEQGELLTLDHIAFKRTNDSSTLKQLQLQDILGLKTKHRIEKDEIIDFGKVEYKFTIADISQFKNTK